MARKLKNVKNETQILFDQESDQKYSKTWKKRNAHWWTCNMARKMKIMENEKNILQELEYDKKHQNMENEKCTLQDLEYGRKNENHGK